MGGYRMQLEERMLNQWFSSRDIANGRSYMKAGRVGAYRETWDDDKINIKCVVRGTRPYDLDIELKSFYNSIGCSAECSCPQFDKAGKCKHIAAALLTHIDIRQHPERHPDCKVTRTARTNDAARKLLGEMRARQELPEAGETEAAVPEKLARLIPVLSLPGSYERNFNLSFKVGYEKPYVVRSISDFIKRVDSREDFSYGKRLTLNHAPSSFDEPSRALIDFLRRIITLLTMGAQSVNRYSSFPAEFTGQSLPLSPRMFEEYFDFLSTLPIENANGKPISLVRGDPQVLAAFSRGDGMVFLNITTDGDWRVSEGGSRLCFNDSVVMLCSPAFAQNVSPLLSIEAREFRFTFDDMPAFCSLVLPRIRNYVDIQDPDGVLSDYMPDECVPRFYFDYADHQLKCKLLCHYDSGDYRPGEGTSVGRRDIRTEDAAVRALSRDFPYRDSQGRFVETDDDKVMTFLSGRIDAYRDMGEVFLSDRLRNQELRPTKATVGVSVSDGMLSLTFDTGGFPPEELEALYQSLLMRRKYHRLKDGRFMRLEGDGTGIEALAETAHMTQLSPAQLKSGEASLPAYRALYLDGVLEKGSGLRVKRNEQFKDLIRRFKTVEDSDYATPEGITGELRPYQETGYRWLKTLESVGFGGILADEMGLGKTLQTIVYFASRPRSETGLPHLVACPASLVLNWQDELKRFAPELKVRLIEGSLRERRKLFSEEEDADVWVTSYDLLKRDVELYAGHEFHTFVLDEGQFVKNQSTKASKAVKSIACRQRFVLTGTPVENRLSELWNLFDFLMPGYLFAHQRFVEKLEKPIAQKGDAEARQQLNRLVRPFILRRLKKDVLKELPDKIEHVRRIQLSESERKVYHAQSLAALQQFEGGGEKLAILAALMRLRQICCDPNLCYENYEGETSKLEACLELVRSMSENGHQILLFSQFTSMLDRIRARLSVEGITSFTLQGSTPREERARLVKEFNRGGAQVFLISLKAGGTGLNLTAADVVIHYDPWWNIAAQNQATDRAHRIGQQNCVQVYKLIASDTVEERILDLQNKKAELLDAVTENAGEDLSRMSQEDLLALIKDD